MARKQAKIVNQDAFRGQFDNIRNGDTIVLNSGAYFATRTGKVYGKSITRWGKEIRVKLEDGTFDTISGITEVGIGAYWYPTSPLRRGVPFEPKGYTIHSSARITL